jgi:hypothetical protein
VLLSKSSVKLSPEPIAPLAVLTVTNSQVIDLGGAVETVMRKNPNVS